MRQLHGTIEITSMIGTAVPCSEGAERVTASSNGSERGAGPLAHTICLGMPFGVLGALTIMLRPSSSLLPLHRPEPSRGRAAAPFRPGDPARTSSTIREEAPS